jgi:hypothetical protein
MKLIRAGDGACWKRMAAVGGRENGGRKKKEEMRKNEEQRGRRPMYNTRVPDSLAPLVHYRAQGRLAPLLVEPGGRYTGARPNGTL